MGDQGEPHRRDNLSYERLLLAERWKDVKKNKGGNHHRMAVDEATDDQEESATDGSLRAEGPPQGF